ncbi:MAG TPA: NADH-quinone oxidoreductase subunit N [Rubrobacteraceae bacterium]|nr:NADH-quinone oxidoreductase subunit N [Rubrobacteraceae bacterium]
MPTGDAFIALLPELIATGFVILTLLVGVFAERNVGLVAGVATLGTLAVFGSAAGLLASGFSGSYFGGGFVVDDFALYFKLIVAASAFFAVLASARWSGYTGDAGEYLTLILSVLLGSILLVSMRDLFGIFLAVELATIPSYAMVAFDRSRRESAEGGMKYLITGVIASSVLLYGIVLIYGISGSANLADVANALAEGLSPVALVGLVLLISGFAFKVSAAPFHFWTPDAYQGAPTSAAAFLSVAPKAAIFAILLRILLEGMPEAAPAWTALMAVLAIITMFVGNLFALRQRNVRRMLAYSSVAHSGYILAAFAALQGEALTTAVEAVLIYTAAYALMNMGAFLTIDLVGEDSKSFNGLFRVRPALALAMGVFMASLVGIPPFSGFFGKAWVILAGAQSGSVLVYVVVGALVVNSVLSVPYYFGIIRNMFFEEPTRDAQTELGGTGAVRFSVYALAVGTTLFIFFIGPLSALARASGLL